MPLTPAIRAFLDELQALIDDKDWPHLDRDRVTVTHGRTGTLVVLPHTSRPALGVEVEVHDHEVWVQFGAERIRFTRHDEARRFVEMLGDGRVELLVQRNPVWTTVRAYRDSLALPFRKSSHPWPNLRSVSERTRFGFA